MRVLLIMAALLSAALVGYVAPSRVMAHQEASFGQAGLVQGEKVRLILTEPDRGAQECTVIAVQGDFLGCRNERASVGQPGYNRWYNLRLLIRIDRPARPE